MNPFDLRLGNLVYVITNGNIEPVRNIHENFGTFIRPIPLTEEWLLNFGFELNAESSICKSWVIGENPMTHDYMLSLVWMKNDYGDLAECFYMNGYHVIKHVHQLQNLYYALTGKELEASMPKVS